MALYALDEEADNLSPQNIFKQDINLIAKFPTIIAYTTLFEMARIAGWCAHRLEELISSMKIIRPAYKNVVGTRRYLPIVERNEQM